MVNASLLQGRLPSSQKHAIVMPLLKKPGLDTADMNNFRPVSNLSFLSKLIERAVANQLNEYIDSHLSMSAQVSAVYRSGYYQLWQLRPLTKCMTKDAIKMLTHAFISSRLDYCNALAYITG